VDLRNLEFACENCPEALRVWRALRHLSDAHRAEETFSGWARFFGDLLRVTGWPGAADFSSHEQDVIDGWKDALSELASLDLIAKPDGLELTVRELRRILGRTQSAAPELAAPVQILDASSAASLHFDSATAIGMSDENWPVYKRPSPLIPLKIQRSAGLPGSTAESRRKQAVRDSHALLASADTVLISYSGRLAPVIAEHVAAGTQPLVWTGKTAVESFSRADLEAVDDSCGPTYQSSEVLTGGTRIIRSQSLCAFRAFAEYRLHAISPEDPSLGFDARDRGTFLHKALEVVWRELQSSERLACISQSDLDELIGRAIDAAVQERQNDDFRRALSVAERHLLRELIEGWLRLERTRKHPFNVEILEQQREVELGGLRFTIRIDRVDRLPNGRSLLIDYKTAKSSSSALDCPRPKEPQLLIYAATESAVDGVLFAQIRPDDIRPVGATRADYWNAPKLVCKRFDNWLETARNEVERLATEFVSGLATVNPGSNTTCKYCGADALCRRSEWSLEADSDSGDR
jgi:ATP-dependent helicase/nuclease subunit B